MNDMNDLNHDATPASHSNILSALGITAPMDDAGHVDLTTFAKRLADATADPEVRHLIGERLFIPNDLRTEELFRSFGIGFASLLPANSDHSPAGLIAFVERDPVTGDITSIAFRGKSNDRIKRVYQCEPGVLFNAPLGLTLLHDKPAKHFVLAHPGPAFRFASEGQRVVLRPFHEDAAEPVLIFQIVESNGRVTRMIDNDTNPDQGVVIREADPTPT